MRIWTNPDDLPAELLADCDAICDLIIDHVPAGATTTVHGGWRTITVAAEEVEPQPAARTVSGPNGRAYRWPVWSCQQPMLVVIDADADTISSTSSVTVSTVVREA